MTKVHGMEITTGPRTPSAGEDKPYELAVSGWAASLGIFFFFIAINT
jgi:hypothetical protein